MPRALIAGLLVVVAVGAAVLVMGVPGEDDADVPAAPTQRVGGAAEAPADPARARTPESEAVLDAAREREARRAQPDARLFGGLGSAWNAVRYHLSGVDSPEADAFSDRIEPLAQALQDAYRRPDAVDLGELLARSDALEQELRASPLAAGAVGAQLDRIDRLARDHAAARANGGNPLPEGEAAPTEEAPARVVP